MKCQPILWSLTLLVVGLIAATLIACGPAPVPAAPAAPAATAAKVTEATKAPAATAAKATEATKAPAATAAKATEATKAPAAAAVTRTVAILIADAFQQVPKATGKVSAGNCVVCPDGQSYDARGAGCGAGQKEPHGVLVYRELANLLVKAAWTLEKDTCSPTGQPFACSITWCESKDCKGRQIELVMVDLTDPSGNLTTEGAADRIGNTRTALEKSVDGFVINMSFAIVPCDPASIAELQGSNGVKNAIVYLEKLTKDPNLPDVKKLQELLTDLQRPDIAELEKQKLVSDYLVSDIGEALRGAAYSPLVDQTKDGTLTGGLPGWLGNDSLLAFTGDSKTGKPTISVAAAGNSGFNFPFAPAIWDSVLSVSAGDEGQKPAAYSNWGDVIASGVHPMDTAVVGTSFAAPRMSLAAAFYLLDKHPASCGTASPPLKTAAPQSRGPWRNLDVPAAMAATSSTTTRCSGFPTPMP